MVGHFIILVANLNSLVHFTVNAIQVNPMDHLEFIAIHWKGTTRVTIGMTSLFGPNVQR
jgi:hypothetical protein